MSQFTYTFIIPHKNTPRLLERCLDSIPSRDDIQIVVVDDGSEPRLRPSVGRKDVELLHIDERHTKGAGHARNVGLEVAKGRWVLFADSDDYYVNGFVNVLDCYKDSEFDVIFFNYDHIDGKTGKDMPVNEQQLMIAAYKSPKFDIDYLRFQIFAPWNKMVSRAFLTDNDIRFEEVPNGNDIQYALKIGVNLRKITVVPESLYVHVRTPNSISTRTQTVEQLLCRYRHNVRCNAFNRHIGHKEYSQSHLVCVLVLIKKSLFLRTIPFMVRLLFALPGIIRHRNDWSTAIFGSRDNLQILAGPSECNQ